jgi:hypothetical protein
MGPKGKLGKNDKLQFINRIGIYENHNLSQIAAGRPEARVDKKCSPLINVLNSKQLPSK